MRRSVGDDTAVGASPSPAAPSLLERTLMRSSTGPGSRGFDPRAFDPRGFDPRTFDFREAAERLREAFGPREHGGHERHDVRGAILVALHGGAKNGHEVMQAIAAAHEGWMPAASEVYPTLQQLTDEGLVSSRHEGERTVYELTPAGAAAAAEQVAQHEAHRAEHERGGARGWGDWSRRDHAGPWAQWGPWSEHDAAVPKAGAKLAQAAAQVAHSGTQEQKERAAALLDETRRKLYAILAED